MRKIITIILLFISSIHPVQLYSQTPSNISVDTVFDKTYINGFREITEKNNNNKKVISFYKNGSIASATNIILKTENGKSKFIKDGLWTWWYDNGLKREEINYCEGLPCGYSIKWNRDSSLSDKEFFVIDTINEVRVSNLDGNYFSIWGMNIEKSYFINGFKCLQEIYYDTNSIKSRSVIFFKGYYYDYDLSINKSYFINGQFQLISTPGIKVEFYSNGNVKSIKNYDINSSLVGYNILWNTEGKLIYFKYYNGDNNCEKIKNPELAKNIFEKYKNIPEDSGSIVQNKREGLWCGWYFSNQKSYECYYKNGKPNGKAIVYYPNGNIMIEIEMEEGFANGNYISYFENGAIYEKAFYENGKKTGDRIKYFKNGNIEEETKYKSKESESYTKRKYYKNGNLEYEVNYDNNRLNGLQAEWYENGNPRTEENYNKGKKDGRFSAWYENGVKKFEYHVIDGNWQGKYESFYSNGIQESEENINKGKNHGISKTWFDDGKLCSIGNYIDGIKDGEFLTYWQNGNIKEIKYYKLDDYVGTWIEYNKNGSIKNQVTYNSNSDFLLRQCNCIDSLRIPKISSFNQNLSSIIYLNDVNKKRFKYTAPLGDFYNDILYSHYYSMSDYIFSQVNASLDIYSRKPMVFEFPDKKGIKLTLNPCIIVKGNGYSSKMELEVRYIPEKEYNITIYPQYVSLEFNKKILHQWNDSITEKKDIIPSKILIKTKSVYYEKDGINIELNEDEESCFRTAEIGNSKILIDISNFGNSLNLNLIKSETNPFFIKDTLFELNKYDITIPYYKIPFYKINIPINFSFKALCKLGFKYAFPVTAAKMKYNKLIARKDFGLKITDATITLPKDFFSTNQSISCVANDIYITGDKIYGTIHLNSIFKEKSKYYFIWNNEKVYFTKRLINKIMRKKGFKTFTEYLNSEFIIYFRYN